MADQQAELDTAIQGVRDTILAEVSEIKTIIEGLQPGQPLDLSKLNELKAAVSGMSDAVAPAAPAPGLHNVSLSASSEGVESMKASLVNNGVSEERATLLRRVFDATKAAAAAQAAGGAAFRSTLAFSDNGASEAFTLDNGKQKAAADVAFLGAFLAEAQAQLEA